MSSADETTQQSGRPKNIGYWVAGGGCIFGLLPLIFSFLALALGSNAGNVIHWYTLFTAPIGGLVVVAGIVIASVQAAKNSNLSGYRKLEAKENPASSKGADPDKAVNAEISQKFSSKVIRFIRISYILGAALVVLSSFSRAFYFQGGGILTLFDLLPAAFAILFVVLAWRSTTSTNFMKLFVVQRVVGIAGITLSLWPLIYLTTYIDLLQDPEIESLQMLGTIITDYVPAIASIASLIFAYRIKQKFLKQVKD